MLRFALHLQNLVRSIARTKTSPIQQDIETPFIDFHVRQADTDTGHSFSRKKIVEKTRLPTPSCSSYLSFILNTKLQSTTRSITAIGFTYDDFSLYCNFRPCVVRQVRSVSRAGTNVYTKIYRHSPHSSQRYREGLTSGNISVRHGIYSST